MLLVQVSAACQIRAQLQKPQVIVKIRNIKIGRGLKNAKALNAIGEELAPIYETKYLTSDFKKREGYKRSIQLSAQYGLYRQDYCGCAYSKAERERQKAGQSE